MSGWRKRQIAEREHMNYDANPFYGKITYTINPNVDWSKVTLTTPAVQRVVKNEYIEDMLIENYLEQGDFSEAIAIIDRIRNDR